MIQKEELVFNSNKSIELQTHKSKWSSEVETEKGQLLSVPR